MLQCAPPRPERFEKASLAENDIPEFLSDLLEFRDSIYQVACNLSCPMCGVASDHMCDLDLGGGYIPTPFSSIWLVVSLLHQYYTKRLSVSLDPTEELRKPMPRQLLARDPPHGFENMTVPEMCCSSRSHLWPDLDVRVD